MQITDARSEIHKQIHSVDSENNSIRQEKSTMVPTPSVCKSPAITSSL